MWSTNKTKIWKSESLLPFLLPFSSRPSFFQSEKHAEKPQKRRRRFPLFDASGRALVSDPKANHNCWAARSRGDLPRSSVVRFGSFRFGRSAVFFCGKHGNLNVFLEFFRRAKKSTAKSNRVNQLKLIGSWGVSQLAGGDVASSDDGEPAGTAGGGLVYFFL